MSINKCKAITKAGTRCRKNAKTAGFCGIHLPKTQDQTLIDKAKTVTEITVAISGIIGIIKALVELWQHLPFGVGPDMPESYERLSEEVGPSWNGMPDTYSPFSRSGETVDWDYAERIYNGAVSLLNNPPEDRERVEHMVSLLEAATIQFIDGLPDELRERYLRRLGSDG
jgi:hypothetical protein